MPQETAAAIAWALTQSHDVLCDDGVTRSYPITLQTPHLLVDKVREYFNENRIAYEMFSFDDLAPFLN